MIGPRSVSRSMLIPGGDSRGEPITVIRRPDFTLASVMRNATSSSPSSSKLHTDFAKLILKFIVSLRAGTKNDPWRVNASSSWVVNPDEKANDKGPHGFEL
eukprot:CAMPEP_0174993146 /NCGR_PEP_ID=MMETSP0004_2-20121128/22914_1 /TAXON_ID=420556 /ORGANISM="Ochromonas sp., Strain CCMP1393" /LENGTH=100 /DNA_ID=CAMNT_0016247231 /DNA_START=624 /DNA_END=926 /DNA_ORIENTATION=+